MPSDGGQLLKFSLVIRDLGRFLFQLVVFHFVVFVKKGRKIKYFCFLVISYDTVRKKKNRRLTQSEPKSLELAILLKCLKISCSYEPAPYGIETRKPIWRNYCH